MGFLAVVFIFVALVMGARIYFGMLDTHVMPMACPSCHHESDRSMAGRLYTWFTQHHGRFWCRSCHKPFKEHPNGTLVEDRDV